MSDGLHAPRDKEKTEMPLFRAGGGGRRSTVNKDCVPPHICSQVISL